MVGVDRSTGLDVESGFFAVSDAAGALDDVLDGVDLDELVEEGVDEEVDSLRREVSLALARSVCVVSFRDELSLLAGESALGCDVVLSAASLLDSSRRDSLRRASPRASLCRDRPPLLLFADCPR